MAPGYSSMTVKDLEAKIELILRKQRNRDDLFRAAVFMGQMDVAKFIYHDKKYQPDTRFVSGSSKSSETAAYGQALVQLLLLAKSRGMDFPEVFRYALEHMEGVEEFKARTPQSRKEIRGMPVGKGKVRGKAFVASDYDAMEKAPEGSILVLEHADSQISHMIRRFSAVVSDQGGRLSHLAIVAREKGIPVILGTGNATKLIKTGDSLIVDIDSGEVIVTK